MNVLPRDRTGERLGVFEITGDLAAGGMSMVYKWRRADGTFEQQNATKLFRTDLLNHDVLHITLHHGSIVPDILSPDLLKN